MVTKEVECMDTQVLADPVGTVWLVECSICGPLGTVTDPECDTFLLAHFYTH